MKYANSIKYVNSFERAGDRTLISQKRIRALCEHLGRVNLGMRYINLPKSTAGHACAVMLESVIKAAGYKVGRITSVSDFDPRESVFVDRAVPNIDDVSKSVAEIRSFIKANPDEVYYKEEVVFALSLLLCKLSDCTFVILEGLFDKDHSLDAICAPYDLIVMPTVYDIDGTVEEIKPQCEAIRRGTREVISGNQKSDVYNCISNACAMSGVRLYIPAKSQFVVTEQSVKKLSFEYGGRDGYTLRSPSYILRDCAITVIEASLAIRRSGFKLPWSAISDGLLAATDTLCFDVISVMPMVIADAASSYEETELLLKTCFEVGIDVNELSICVRADSFEEVKRVADWFEDNKLYQIIVVGDGGESDISKFPALAQSVCVYNSAKAAAKEIFSSIAMQKTPLICLGSLRFSTEFKNELLKLMSF